MGLQGGRRSRYGHGVAKRVQYRCSECHHVTAKWVGRCPDCGAWGTVDEVAVSPHAVNGGSAGARSSASPAVPISPSTPRAPPSTPGVSELDRVLGAGWSPAR